MIPFITSKLFSSPLDAMFTLLSFIFVKELGASPLQLTLLVASKPLVGLLAFYNHIFIKNAPSMLKPLLIVLNALGAIPCLLFPFTNSVWFFLLAYALFILSLRSSVPAWVELLKINLSPQKQAQTFSLGASANYLITIFFPLGIAQVLDHSTELWKWIFFALAALQLGNIIILATMRLKIAPAPIEEGYSFSSMRSLLLDPWKNFITLMRKRPDFRSYQIMFVISGIGLVAMQPALPIFFKETLNLTYTELTLATHVCKGIGFALSSPVWARFIHRVSLFTLNAYVNLCSAIFIILLLSSSLDLSLLYAAFTLYGIMQAGCELSWNLSGTIFAGPKESTFFTSSNLAVIGMRGCFSPFLGQLFLLSGTTSLFLFAECLCLIGLFYAWHLSRVQAPLYDQVGA